jgi:hypothetical protein
VHYIKWNANLMRNPAGVATRRVSGEYAHKGIKPNQGKSSQIKPLSRFPLPLRMPCFSHCIPFSAL